MSRPPMPIGSWGQISTWVTERDDKGKPTKHKSQARFRDHDGHLRPVSAYGKTKTAAERALLKKLQDRANTNRSGELTALHKIDHLLDLWEQRFEALIADGKRSPTSLDTYRRALKNHIRPARGELRIGEANTPRIDTVLTKIKTTAGVSTAKTCRAIISGAMKLAVRYGATSVNPSAKPTPSKPHQEPTRALTSDEVRLLRASLAVVRHQVDLEARTVEIAHTIARIAGEGLIRKATKSKAGERLLHLPDWAVAMIRTRQAAGIRLDEPVFPDTRAGYRDPLWTADLAVPAGSWGQISSWVAQTDANGKAVEHKAHVTSPT